MSTISRRLAAAALTLSLIAPTAGVTTAHASSFGSSSAATQDSESLASKEARLKTAVEKLLTRSGHTIDRTATGSAELNLVFAKQGLFSYDGNSQYRDGTIDGTGFVIITRFPHNAVDSTIRNINATPSVDTGGPRLVGVAVGSDDQFTYLVEQYKY